MQSAKSWMRNQIKQHNFFKKQPLGESEKRKDEGERL